MTLLEAEINFFEAFENARNTVNWAQSELLSLACDLKGHFRESDNGGQKAKDDSIDFRDGAI